jgi:hypothetical protein
MIKFAKKTTLFGTVTIVVSICITVFVIKIFIKSITEINDVFFIIISACIFIFLCRIIDKYYNTKFISKFATNICKKHKEPFIKKWCSEIIAIDLVNKISYYIPFNMDHNTAEKLLCHSLPIIFSGPDQKIKVENAILNLLIILELYKAFNAVYSPPSKKYFLKIDDISSIGLQNALTFLKKLEPYVYNSLPDLDCILVLMRAILYFKKEQLQSFDENQLEELLTKWEDDKVFSKRQLPKSLNKKEFIMENYTDDEFKEFVIAFSVFCGSGAGKLLKYADSSFAENIRFGKKIPPEAFKILVKKKGNIINT